MYTRWTGEIAELEAHDPDERVKRQLVAAYRRLLDRYPCLVEYWRRFSLAQYKFSGTHASVDVLEQSVAAVPYSIELWNDYLSALLSQYELEGKPAQLLKQIRTQFQKCLDLNGHHYNSDPLWDKYLGFMLDLVSKEVLETYKRLIHIPLYEYAKYLRRFAEIVKDFAIGEVLLPEELQVYESRYGRLVGELLLVEQHQILDQYTSEVFETTQSAVTEKWTYEADLTISSFSIEAKEAIAKEAAVWRKYIEFELGAGDTSRIRLVYERALVPNCHDWRLWLEYIQYLETADLDAVPEVFQRAARIDLADEVRWAQVPFYLRHNQPAEATEFLFSTIGNALDPYDQHTHLEGVRRILDLWGSTLPPAHFEVVLSSITEGFFEQVDRYKSMPESTFDSANIARLQKLLNHQSACVVLVRLLHQHQLHGHHEAIRQIFSTHHKQVGASAAFWRFFVEYEGVVRHNYPNLERIMNYVKTQSSLPKAAVDALVARHYDIVQANLTAVLQQTGSCAAILSAGADTSNSIAVNTAAQRRLAANSHVIHNLEQRFPIDKHAETTKLLRTHAGHPGVYVKQRPAIAHGVDFGVDLRGDVAPPALPSFRNVERANAPPSYEI